MTKPEIELPEHLKKTLRTLMLDQMGKDTLDLYEFELFDWYVKETEVVLSKMLSSERAYIEEQIATGNPEINDSGMLAVEYNTKRIRYSHIIYLASLFESCLERACSKLITAVGHEVMPFGPTELKGDQWAKRRKFLERYGDITIPKELWSEPNMLNKIRNYLVHENGSTTSISDEERKEINKRPGVDIKSTEFVLEETYIRHASEALRKLVQAVETGVGEVIQKAQQGLKNISH